MTNINSFPQALTIAGSDAGGGAGLQADLKTMQMRQVFGTNVVVALTAQNTYGVQATLPVPPQMIDDQFASLAADFQIRACKTGMLGDATTVKTVANNLQKYDFGPYVLDPVMIAKGGAKLLTDDAIDVIKQTLLPLATLITPNLPEASRLTGLAITDAATTLTAARQLQALGAQNVLIKGGHHDDATAASDLVLLADGTFFWLTAPRTATKRTHGTGDTISSCIVAELAKGADLTTALWTAKSYVTATIQHPIQVGHGHGPLNHWAL